MTNSSSIKELVQTLNDRGAQLIVEGSYSEAIQLFYAGLAFVVEIKKNVSSSSSANTLTPYEVLSEDLVRDLKLASDQCMSSNVSGSTASTKPGGWMDLPDLSSSYQVSSISSEQHHSNLSPLLPPSSHRISSCEECSTSSKDQPFLFQHPMRYDHFKSTPDSLFLDTGCFSFVFNMAICHDKRAWMMVSSTREAMSDILQADAYAALALYDIAFQLATSDQACIPLVFSCAVLNNAAQLQYGIMNNMNAFLGHSSTLLGFLLYCVDDNQHGLSYDARDESIQLLQEYLPDFFGAVSHLVLSTTQVANAA